MHISVEANSARVSECLYVNLRIIDNKTNENYARTIAIGQMVDKINRYHTVDT